MANFSIAKTNQALAPDTFAQYPFAGLDPVLFTFNRFDIFTWNAALRRATGQLLGTDSGWIAGTRVGLLFPDGTLLYDTVATISESAGNTNLTFTTYNSEATSATTVFNLDYVGYRMKFRIRLNRAYAQEQFTVYVPFAANGYCSIDVAALVRDWLNTHPEWLANETRNVLGRNLTVAAGSGPLVEGPVADEVVECLFDYWVECNSFPGISYGWNGTDDASLTAYFYHAREYKGLVLDNVLPLPAPGAPSLYLQSARDYVDLADPLLGGVLVEYGARPRWKCAPTRALGMSCFGVVSFVWHSGSLNTLPLTLTYAAGTTLNFTVTANGMHHMSYGEIPRTSKSVVLSSSAYGVDNTFSPFTADVQLCDGPLIFLWWRNSVGGYSCWAFEQVEGQKNIAQRGDIYSAANLDGGRGAYNGPVSLTRQATIGQRRAPANSRALEVALLDRALSEANVIYLQSLLEADEVYLVEGYYGTNSTTDQSTTTAVTITAGDAPLRKHPNDLYEFRATLNIPQR